MSARRMYALLACAAMTMAAPALAEEPGMAIHRLTLWQAIDALAAQIPFARAQVERTLGVTLAETGNRSNALFYLYGGGPATLADGVVVTNVDLRIRRDGGHPGFMVLELAGQCVTLAQVRNRYGKLRLSGVPRGHSIHDTTAHSSDRPWGTLTFSFAERHPDCLASIAFDPAKALLP